MHATVRLASSLLFLFFGQEMSAFPIIESMQEDDFLFVGFFFLGFVLFFVCSCKGRTTTSISKMTQNMSHNFFESLFD